MTKIEELNPNSKPPITDEEFHQWKSSWNGVGPIPEKIHDYMKRVALPATEKAIAAWYSLSSNV